MQTKILTNPVVYFKILCAFLFISTISLLIFQLGVVTQKIYLIEVSQRDLSALSEQNKSLEINFARLDSLSNIDDHLAISNFLKVKAKEIKYIQILDSEVAKNR